MYVYIAHVPSQVLTFEPTPELSGRHRLDLRGANRGGTGTAAVQCSAVQCSTLHVNTVVQL